MLSSLRGPNGHNDLESSHALPALIRKFHLGKLASLGARDAIDIEQDSDGALS
jgi:GDP-L-fucose synthase